MIENKKILQNGLTFDDVLVIPSYSELMPSETNITTSFSKNIKINIPILSAAMDTVTESKMAISLAREGGIGKSFKSMDVNILELEKKKIIELLLNDGKLIKRPFLVINESKLILGFNESEYASKLK